MSTGLFKRHFKLPTLNKITNDVKRRQLYIRTKQCLGLKAPLGIANEHPANWHGRFTRVIPHRSLRGQLDGSWPLTIPSCHRDLLPYRFLIHSDLSYCRQPLAFFARSSLLAPWSRSCRFIEGGIEAQSRDHR